MNRVWQACMLSLVGLMAGVSPAAGRSRSPMLAPPVWVFLLPTSVVGGSTTVHTHHATHTRIAPYPVTYSYIVALPSPASSLAYTVEIYPAAVYARQAAAGNNKSSLSRLPLAHPAIRGEWLRGVVSDHYCALLTGAVFRNLVVSVSAIHTYLGARHAQGCRQDMESVLGVERHLVSRAQGFAARR